MKELIKKLDLMVEIQNKQFEALLTIEKKRIENHTRFQTQLETIVKMFGDHLEIKEQIDLLIKTTRDNDKGNNRNIGSPN